MSSLGIFEQIDRAKEGHMLCEIRFFGNSKVIGYITEFTDLGMNQEPLIKVYDVEGVQTGFCPVRLIQEVKEIR